MKPLSVSRCWRWASTAGNWLGLALVLAGCADELPVVSLAPLKPSMESETRWKETVGSGEATGLSPVVFRKSIYGADAKGRLRALDSLTGKELWQVRTEESFSAGVGAGDELLFLGNRKGELLAYDLNGQFRWRTALSSELMMAPQAAHGVVVTLTADGHLYGLNSSDGHVLWNLTRPLPSLVLRGVSQVGQTEGVVFVGLPGGKMLALDQTTGKLDWEATISVPRGATELERINDLVGNPIFAGRELCTASYQTKVVCLNLERGEPVWTHDLAVAGALAEQGNKLYATTDKGDVIALYRASGSVAWKSEALEGRYPSPPGVWNDYLVVGDARGIVHYLNLSDGVEVGRTKTDSAAIVQPPLALDSTLVLVQNREGKLFALAPHALEAHLLPAWINSTTP